MGPPFETMPLVAALLTEIKYKCCTWRLQISVNLSWLLFHNDS